MAGDRPTGLTRDAGWQVGIQRTLPCDPEAAWALLTSPAGLACWLGEGATLPATRGEDYETVDGTTGELRSLRPGDRIRLTWQPPGWDHDATVQVAIHPTGSGTAVRFHTERLAGPEEREALRTHWQGVLEDLRTLLDP